ncbi:MAG: YczE/YyaS/YitT family protein [Paracoccaceae bacterium]
MKAISKIFSLTSVPNLFWSAPTPLSFKPPLQSVLFLFLGLMIFGFGHAILFGSNFGVSPWMVLAQGFVVQFGIGIGLSIILVSFAVLLFWIPLKEKPGIGTFINFFVVAAVIEITLPYIPNQTENLLKLVQVFVAILIIGLGGSIYLIANLGPGPRDGLMTGLSKKTRIPMAYVRNFLEISVVIFGWSLGGTAGVGTLIFAILIGPVTVTYMYFIKTTFDK